MTDSYASWHRAQLGLPHSYMHREGHPFRQLGYFLLVTPYFLGENGSNNPLLLVVFLIVCLPFLIPILLYTLFFNAKKTKL